MYIVINWYIDCILLIIKYLAIYKIGLCIAIYIVWLGDISHAGYAVCAVSLYSVYRGRVASDNSTLVRINLCHRVYG